jgi:hypothetical protein
MKRSMRILMGCFCLVIFTVIPCFAKAWHGIIPLHSTRDDVKKLLGKPARQSEMFDDYELGRYTVSILYATENVLDTTDDCDSPLRYWWGYYHVSVGTVLSVLVRFEDEIPLVKFKIPDFKKLSKGEPDSTLLVDYFDRRRGIQYSVRDKKIVEIEYGPSAADASLRCPPDPAAKAKRARVIQICNQLYGPMIDRRLGLYAINPFYVLRLTFARRGELIALAVEPKYYYDFAHTDWEERDDFRNLSKTDYERLLAEIDKIKPKGPLVEPASPTSVVTNFTAWRRETYQNAILEWGEVADSRRTADAPFLARWFKIFYVKRRAT